MQPDGLEAQANRLESSVGRRVAEVERGRQAKELLAHPLLSQAFAQVESDLQRLWSDSHPRDVALRDDAWRCLRLLKMVRGNIEHHVGTGKLATMQLPLERKALSKVRRALERVGLR